MKEPIDVLLLAHDDFANTGYRFWQCLRMLGLNAVMFKGVSHPFGYPYQAPIHPSLTMMPYDRYPTVLMARGIDGLIKSSRVVHFLASTYVLPDKGPNIYKNKKVVVQHGGTTYRMAPQRSNFLFNQIADATIIQCPDLLCLGAKNEHLIYYPVDCDFIRPEFNKKDPDKLIIGHFPSNPSVKGTETIVDVINQLSKKYPLLFDYVGIDTNGTLKEVIAGCKAHHMDSNVVSWEENLKRLKSCDVIIETCQAELNGKPFGEWGNTALEAAASGCIVVTNSHSQDLYLKEYGASGLKIANNAEALYSKLEYLIMSTDEEIRKMKEQSRAWAKTFHSMESTAIRLGNKVYSKFFPEKALDKYLLKKAA